ncbi:hypothetical protein [Nocardia sp. BMG51109]|uniref:hypothetical protein n=1 Tax=Nocardia sp. BMG51109 TaxID=1056816 RepID=UPI0004668FA6|nr:hypothetical protein [Nocardia sp. BMG51109]
MSTETVSVAEVRHGDVIRDPEGRDFWREVREVGFGARHKEDGTGEQWDLYVFFGPFVDARADSDAPGDRPGVDRFVFREDAQVIRRLLP